MYDPIEVNGGNAIRNEQRLYRFPNGYGASVIRGPGTYGGSAGLFELAVLRFTGPGNDDRYIDYETPLTDDVIGHLSESDVQDLLKQIAALE